jgi:hypothetical protein
MKMVPLPRGRFDECRVLCRVTQSQTQFRHRSADALLEIDERVRRPKRFTNRLTADDPAGFREQQCQYPERLLLQSDLDAAPSQFAVCQVNLKATETADRSFWTQFMRLTLSKRMGRADVINWPLAGRFSSELSLI